MAPRAASETPRRPAYPGADLDSLAVLQQQMRQYRRLTARETNSLLRLAQAGDDEARDKLILHNLGLIHFVVRKYAGTGLSTADHIQESIIGLMEAINRFDHRPNTAFASYAAWCIRGAISHNFRKVGPLVHIPANVNLHVGRLRRRIAKYPNESFEEAVASLELPANEERLVQTAYGQSSVSFNTDSTDASVGRYSPEDVLVSVSILDPEQTALAKSLYQEIGDKLANLYVIATSHPNIKERNARIFAAKLGLTTNYVGRTLESVGREFDITRERVRQIVERCWHRIRRLTDLNEENFSDTVERYRDLEDLVNS